MMAIDGDQTFEHVRRCLERPWLFLQGLLQEGHMTAMITVKGEWMTTASTSVERVRHVINVD